MASNRCQLYQFGDPCFIDRNSSVGGYSAQVVRVYYRDLYQHIRQIATHQSFTDDDIIICNKHFNRYKKQHPSVPHSLSPPPYGN
jgi:hypothetical protein